MKRLIYIFCLLIFSIVGQAQTYSYLGVKDGLSHRSIYSIKKDTKGYMWFLTHEGADRYNGKEFKHYSFYDGVRLLNTAVHLKDLYYTEDNILWQVGPDGRVFKFNEENDSFDLFYTYPYDGNENIYLNFSYIDNSSRIWMSYKNGLIVYDYVENKNIKISQHPLYEVTAVAQIDDNKYLIGTTNSIYTGEINNNELIITNSISPDDTEYRFIELLHYHAKTNSLVISTRRHGVFVRNLEDNKLTSIPGSTGFSINTITDFSDEEVLIATNGDGVIKLNIQSSAIETYIYADYDTNYGMNGNNIKDVFVDEGNRIWLANYPSGITIRYSTNIKYHLIQHQTSTRQSLVHNEVNAFLEDSDGDQWFVTNNGVSLYRTKQNKWNTYLSTYNKDPKVSNHIYFSIAEIRPGVVWVGALHSESYEINKHTNQYTHILSRNQSSNNQVDNQVKAIHKDTDESVWVGGHYFLRHIDLKTMQMRYYNNLSAITDIEKLDDDKLWVGTSRGLYILDKRTGITNPINLPVNNSDINALLQMGNDTLFIGTNEGLLIFDIDDGDFTHYSSSNSPMLSNSVMSLVEDKFSNYIFIATDEQITRFDKSTKKFNNWSKDQGLIDTFFSTNAGIQLQNRDILFGTIDGVISFNSTSEFPDSFESKLIFEDLEVNQKLIRPNDKTNILIEPLDDTSKIFLRHRENNISIKVGTINYDNPSNMLYSWKLEGIYDDWSKFSEDSKYTFTNLSPNSYVLKVRTSYSDNPQNILEERELHIKVMQPWWWSIGAKVAYIILITSGVVFIIIYIKKQSEKRLVDHTKRFYFSTAHDMQVPLRLIKAPLQELKDTEQLTTEGQNNIKVVLRNLNQLLTENDNAINYDKMDKQSQKLYLSEHHLSPVVEELVKRVETVAEIKQVNLNLRDTLEPDTKIWIDHEKVKAILSYLFNHIIELTFDFKTVNIILGMRTNEWFLEITYEGEIFIFKDNQDLEDEDQYIDKAIHQNSSIVKTIGSRLISKLLRSYKGSINIKSIGKANVFIGLNLPIYRRAISETTALPPTQPIDSLNNKENEPEVQVRSVSSILDTEKGNSSDTDNKNLPLILLAETDEVIIKDIKEHIASSYNIEVISKGEEVISLAKKLRPALILSKMHLEDDIKGVDLAVTLKSQFETSHIPIVLLTDNNDEKYILKGLENGADEFILKPFNYRILKATIANILNNRALLRDRYANLEIEDSVECLHCSSNLDWKFIASIQKNVEEHMSETDFTVDKLCAIMSMSRTSFYNKLKDLTNTTPSDYIRLIKLNYAAKLLVEKEFTIAEIAEKTGFNDAKYFREVFKKHFKTTPSKYAKDKS